MKRGQSSNHEVARVRTMQVSGLHKKRATFTPPSEQQRNPQRLTAMSSFLSSLFGSSKPVALTDADSPPSPGYVPAPGHAACTFGAGCFWSPQLAFDRQPGVVKTEVGYSQGASCGRGARDSCAQRSILFSLQQPGANSVEMERRSERWSTTWSAPSLHAARSTPRAARSSLFPSRCIADRV